MPQMLLGLRRGGPCKTKKIEHPRSGSPGTHYPYAGLVVFTIPSPILTLNLFVHELTKTVAVCNICLRARHVSSHHSG
jgi:hypothetical protein